MPSQKPWKTLSVEYPINLPHFRLRKELVKIPAERKCREYFIQESKGWVCIFCVTKDGVVILNWQYKHGIGRHVLELPSGAIEPNETARECARRELREETGYRANRLEHIASFIVDPTGSNAVMHLFFCKNAIRAAPKKADPSESIQNRFVTIPQLLRLVRKGKITVLGHVAAIYTVLAKKALMDLRVGKQTPLKYAPLIRGQSQRGLKGTV
jgi:ADP-ribose diphosphatase